MSKDIRNYQGYWDERYQAEGKIWGESPSRSAEYANYVFNNNGVKSLLVPGSGYGRNTKFFSDLGYGVAGVEISPTAYALALEFDNNTKFYNGSALDMSFLNEQFDAVYCFNLLHLFRKKERNTLILECEKKLKAKGLMFFSVFSEQDPGFGVGREVAKNTFESRPGRPAHYFTEEDLAKHFAKYRLVDSGMMDDPEDHGGKPHVHSLRFICTQI